jgi:metalloendopeptidase OMA1, mitochondrial
MKTMLRFWLVLVPAVVGMTLTFTGCVTNEAGRSQLMLVSGKEEMQLGVAAFSQMKTNVPISKDAKANEMVQRVGKRIASVVNLPDAQWEFVVFESKEPNAFCLPGGKIGVYTGILPITKDDAGLATVLGHEVAHATLHHGAERMSRDYVRQGFSQGLGMALSKQDPAVITWSETIFGTGTQLLEALPHSREQESEADKMGLFYMARAGYNPEEAVGFWERFKAYNDKAGGSQGFWFLRTHPLDAKRIEDLKKLMPEAKAQQKPAP